MSERVSIDIDGHVAVVSLNRPEKHNAVDLRMFEALAAAGLNLAGDSSVRAVVLRGAGPSFCAGVDTSIFQQDDGASLVSRMTAGEKSAANFYQHAAIVWRELPVPVICALHGTAFGAGLQVALGADVRFSTPQCRMSVMEIEWGIIPDMGISVTLPRLMAADRIKELAWSGRVFSGEEALQLGLVTALHADPSSAANDAARAIAARSPEAIRAIKRLFDTAPGLSVTAALALEAELQTSLLGGRNQSEAVMAKLAGRPPEFEDPAL